MKTHRFSEGETVHTKTRITDAETGGEWPTDMDGTVLGYSGDLVRVYVPGHGEVVAQEDQID